MAKTQWESDHAHSGTEFTVRHMLVSKVRGRCDMGQGTLVIDAENPP